MDSTVRLEEATTPVSSRRKSNWDPLRRVLPTPGHADSEVPGGTRIVKVLTQASHAKNEHSGRGCNYDLWKAAKDGNASKVVKALNENAEHTFEVLPDDLDEDTLWYKNRKVSSKAIHAAALCPHRHRLEEPFQEPKENAFHCVRALIEHSADVRAKAQIMDGRVIRELEAIHMAAGAGNSRTVELLIEHRADANAQALQWSDSKEQTANKEIHYYPIHDAVWFNRKESVRSLLRKKADVFAKNKEGNTALHLAAMLGHDDLVKFLLYERHGEGEIAKLYPDKEKNEARNSAMKESLQMVKRKNAKGKDPLTMAVERGHFPANMLHLFTCCFDGLEKEASAEGRVHAFLRVAMTCPDAAPKLVRTKPRLEDVRHVDEQLEEASVKNTEINEEWKASIILGAQKGLITVSTFCDLIDHAPQSAIDLLDMLTTDPKEENKQHNPLPVRANIPYDQEACRLSCAYVEARKWTWKGTEKSPLPWQAKLAPQDPKRSQEVKVKMLMLPGVMNCCLVHNLASTKDQKIFTKLAIHALLKHLWKAFRPLFLVDLGHQFVSTAVLSYWILVASQVETPRIIRCGLWGIFAAEGISECFMFIWTSVMCQSTLGRQMCFRWLKRSLYRFVVGACALALAIETSLEYQPANNSSILLSVNSLLHWIAMLFEIRAFRATGRRILPIMKSVVPIVGMLVIMLFISLGFMHAFWAMDRSDINEISMFNIVVLLFTGEQFLSPEDLLAMEQSKMTAMILLSIGGVFIFLTCTINVFIAVLSDCYDQEQERMVCTFLKERARICSAYFLRPKLKAGFGFIHKGVMKFSWWRWWLLLVLILGLYVLLLYSITGLKILTAWLSAFYPAAAVICVQCILRDVASVGWKTNYLWFCHEVGVEEEMFLAPEQRDEEETNGRITRMKKYIRQTIKDCDLRIKTLSGTMDQWRSETTSNLAHQTAAVVELLFKVNLCLSIPAGPDLPTPRFGARVWRDDRQLEADVLKSALGLRGSKEICRVPATQLTSRPTIPPGPPLGTFPHDVPPPLHPQVDLGEDVGVAEAQDLDFLKQEIGSMKESIEELKDAFDEQREAQEELQRTCKDIQSLLAKVVSIAESRQKKSKKER